MLNHLQVVPPTLSQSIILARDPTGAVAIAPFTLPLDLHYHSTFTTYTGEFNQIWENECNTLVAGARFQSGEFHTSDRLDKPLPVLLQGKYFSDPAAAQDFSTCLRGVKASTLMILSVRCATFLLPPESATTG